MTGRTGGWLARTPRKTKRRSLPTARRLSPGANDYRLYEPSENRYDSSGGVYRSTDGGTTWSAGFLPGLVRADTAAPGPYESAGDPAVVAGPKGTFWYSNLHRHAHRLRLTGSKRSLVGGPAYINVMWAGPCVRPCP